MLTFFRRIRKGFLDGGATSKYLLYAIGEIALVVIGILIALQINNWNEWRKDRNLELKYLKNLKFEMIENSQHASDQVTFSEFQFENVNRILRALYDPEYQLNGELLIAIEHVGWAFPLARVSDTWNELLSNGNTRLIRNDSLRYLISKHHSEITQMYVLQKEWFGYNLGYRRLVGDVMPPELREAIASEMTPVGYHGNMNLQPLNSNVVSRLKNLSGLNGYLSDITMGIRTNKDIYIEIQKSIKEIIKICMEEIDRLGDK